MYVVINYVTNAWNKQQQNILTIFLHMHVEKQGSQIQDTVLFTTKNYGFSICL